MERNIIQNNFIYVGQHFYLISDTFIIEKITVCKIEKTKDIIVLFCHNMKDKKSTVIKATTIRLYDEHTGCFFYQHRSLSIHPNETIQKEIDYRRERILLHYNQISVGNSIIEEVKKLLT